MRWPRCEVGHLPPSSAEVNFQWSYTACYSPLPHNMWIDWAMATLKLFICLIKHPTLETPGKAFVTSTLERYEWSFSFPSHFTPMGKSSWYPLGGGKEKNVSPFWESNSDSLVIQYVAWISSLFFYLKVLFLWHCYPQGRMCMSELLYELLFEDLPGGTKGNGRSAVKICSPHSKIGT